MTVLIKVTIIALNLLCVSLLLNIICYSIHSYFGFLFFGPRPIRDLDSSDPETQQKLMMDKYKSKKYVLLKCFDPSY